MILGHANITTCQIARELRSNNVERGFGAIFVQQSNCTRTAFEVHSKSSWNVVGMQLEVLECSWNIQEWTKNFHSNCIPVHSSSSVIGVLQNIFSSNLLI